jgi:NAD-dependent DNA ligase
MPQIVEITGIGPALAAACAQAGFSRVDEIAGAEPTELATVPGIGETRAVILINAAKSLLNGAGAPKAEDTKRMKAEKSKKSKKKAKAEKPKKDKKKQKKNKQKNNKKNGKGKKNSKKNNSKSGKKK